MKFHNHLNDKYILPLIGQDFMVFELIIFISSLLKLLWIKEDLRDSTIIIVTSRKTINLNYFGEISKEVTVKINVIEQEMSSIEGKDTSFRLNFIFKFICKVVTNTIYLFNLQKQIGYCTH